MKKATHDKPVAFMNSYQNAAEYEFYSGIMAFSLDNVLGRKNQYSIWNYENEVQGKEIVVVTNVYIDQVPFTTTAKGNYQYAFIPNFHSPSNLRIHVFSRSISAAVYGQFSVIFSISKLRGTTVDAEANPLYPFHLSCTWWNKDGFVSQKQSQMHLVNDMLTGKKYVLDLVAPDKPGEYWLQLGVAAGWLPPAINMGRIKVQVN
jgi:hypothetical protein